jgi:hypothetical protein
VLAKREFGNGLFTKQQFFAPLGLFLTEHSRIGFVTSSNYWKMYEKCPLLHKNPFTTDKQRFAHDEKWPFCPIRCMG